MVIWKPHVVERPQWFLQAVQDFQQGDQLVISFDPQKLSEELIQWHQKHFNWHHRDTVRSYTQAKLREHGNRGKRTDFAYFNRAVKYFGYNQFEDHRVQRNKLVCFWDPTKKGDMFGEHNPCLVLVKFQEDGRHLHMTAVFRKRDLLKRMIGNWAMLKYWLAHESGVRGAKPGIITDFSMDTMYNPDELRKFLKR